MGEVTACGICGSTDLAVILDMGMQPLAERDSEPYPLVLMQCGGCSLVQLGYTVNQAIVFPPGHPYATGNTRALREHFRRLAADLEADLAPGDLVVDIGANDGTLINAYSPELRRVAAEPTEQSWKCHADMTCQEFFTAGLGERIRSEHGPAKVVTACNVLAHVPDPHDFVTGVATLLADDGLFVTENHDVDSIISGLQTDTVYHEHLRYYSVASLSRLLAMHGLRVTQVQAIPTHGGSFRTYARRQHAEAASLQRRARDAAAGLHALLTTARRAGHVYGIGATTRATPLIHYADVAHLITCVCEVPSSEKIGQLMPGTMIPVVPDSRLTEDQPPHAVLLAWHIAGSVVPQLRAMGYRGRFIVPLPEARILDD